MQLWQVSRGACPDPHAACPDQRVCGSGRSSGGREGGTRMSPSTRPPRLIGSRGPQPARAGSCPHCCHAGNEPRAGEPPQQTALHQEICSASVRPHG